MAIENDNNTLVLDGIVRTNFNKYQSKKDRENGNIPCVAYSKQANIYFTINAKELKKWYMQSFAEYQKLTININNKKILMFPKRIDTNKVTEEIIHCEFLILEAKRKYILNIPILYEKVSESHGVKNKGTFILTRKTLKLECTPENIPNTIVYDGRNVKIGDKIKVSDLNIPKNTTVKEENIIVATCIGSRIQEEPNDASEEKTAEEKK